MMKYIEFDKIYAVLYAEHQQEHAIYPDTIEYTVTITLQAKPIEPGDIFYTSLEVLSPKGD